MNGKEGFFSIFGVILSAVGTEMQTDIILQRISIIITIIGAGLTILTNLVNWYRKAKGDGKITKDEIKEGVDIIVDGAHDIESQVKEGKENDIQGDRG